MESAGTIESVLLLEKEYKALKQDPSHKPNFYFLIYHIERARGGDHPCVMGGARKHKQRRTFLRFHSKGLRGSQSFSSEHAQPEKLPSRRARGVAVRNCKTR